MSFGDSGTCTSTMPDDIVCFEDRCESDSQASGNSCILFPFEGDVTPYPWRELPVANSAGIDSSQPLGCGSGSTSSSTAAIAACQVNES